MTVEMEALMKLIVRTPPGMRRDMLVRDLGHALGNHLIDCMEQALDAAGLSRLR